MSGINEGIKQPLRFYASVDKQNWRRAWIKGSGLVNQEEAAGINVVICSENTIIPFQIRRKASHLPVSVFELYDTNDLFEMDLILITPGVFTDHMSVVQTQQADNIVWYPRDSFTMTLPAGLHYLKVSDGLSTWYSEVFKVECGFNSEQKINLSILPQDQHLLQTSAVAWTQGADHYTLLFDKKP